MEEYPMVCRTAVVVVPQKPVLDWLKHKYPCDLETLETLQKDSNIYLLPDADIPSMQSEIDEMMELYIRKNCRSIFYHELYEWHMDDMVDKPIKKA